MTTGAAEGTTEGHGGPRRRLSAVSVRTRITLVIAVLATTALTAAGLLVHTLESARIERVVNEQIDQEIAEFRQLRDGIDPETGVEFTDVTALIDLFLRRNVPDEDEMLIGYTGGRPRERTPNRHGAEILSHPEYQQAVARLATEGGTERLDHPTLGEVWVTVVPVRNSAAEGMLVIVNFLADEHSELNGTMRTYAIVALLSLGLIVLIAGLQSGRLLGPLRTLRETAGEITATDLTRRIPEAGNDDITALTRTLNGMLDRLESGFEAQRRFLDDAGHELKTPLTVLSGHLELLDPADLEDFAETRDLLLDEVERMSRLVGDLLVLAKSRRPDFVRRTPVDLEVLLPALLGKARALGVRDWRLDATCRGVVPLDEQRITQAVLQLADNAVRHTEEGTQIGLGCAADQGVVRLWVRDQGPGVPEADRERIFERFARAGHHQGDEGSGLGLSIVGAIAEAHGGSVAVVDSVPHGATFVITVPTHHAELEEDQWPTS